MTHVWDGKSFFFFFVPEYSELLQILQSLKLWWLLKIPIQEIEKQYVSISIKNRIIKQQPELDQRISKLRLEFPNWFEGNSLCIWREFFCIWCKGKRREKWLYFSESWNKSEHSMRERMILQIEQGEKQVWLSLAMFHLFMN